MKTKNKHYTNKLAQTITNIPPRTWPTKNKRNKKSGLLNADKWIIGCINFSLNYIINTEKVGIIWIFNKMPSSMPSVIKNILHTF